MQDSNKTTLTVGIVALFLLVGILIYASNIKSAPSKYDGFAQCLEDKGAVFYGAFWCPHCQDQKALFGSAKKYLPYVECSTADSRGQLPVCSDKKIDTYPTWVFADMSTSTGKISLEDLSQKTGCELPL